MEFTSFRKAIGTETTISKTISPDCLWLTPLSRSYKATATKINPAMPTSCAATPKRNSLSCARILSIVAAAFPWTITLPGTYPMAKKPTIEVTR